jgi:hypothetical protein
LLQGHACAVAVYHALTDGVPVHEVDVRKVQLTGLELHGQSLVYLDDAMAGTRWHVVDQMLAARRVPERNDQGVFQNDAGLTEAEARRYFEFLFCDYTEHPTESRQLQAAVNLLKTPADARVSRGPLLHALTVAAGLHIPETAVQPFADVPADGELARTLKPWIDQGWIAADPRQRFESDRPMPFSEFKQLAFHGLFSALMKAPPAPVDYRPWLVHDTFNGPNRPVAQLASGQKPVSSAAWRIESGQLRPLEKTGTTYFLVDAASPDVDASADVFLEQTKNEAAAGIVFQSSDARNMQRFLLQARGPAVEVRIDSIVEGERQQEERRLIPTMKRGLTLRVVAKGGHVFYFLDGKRITHLQRTYSPSATLVGLVNGGGEASRFDNFEVRLPKDQRM